MTVLTTSSTTQLTVKAITLGCKVNQYESQALLELFKNEGYRETTGEADVVIVNTCAVTSEGERKSRQAARRILRDEPFARVILCGCAVQRSPESMAIPGVTLTTGTANRLRVVELLSQAIREGHAISDVSTIDDDAYEPLSVSSSADGRVRASLKIEDGCEYRCAYCVIPSVRGKVRSRGIESIRSEAALLAESSYREISLVGINLSAYGTDLADGRLDNRIDLADAIIAASDAARSARIRISSLEPTLITPAFIDKLKRVNNLCEHFPLALQSGCDATLARMRRRYNTATFANAVRLLRQAFPGCAITTDIIAGFPGETDEEFSRTVDFVKEIGFSRIHVFPYSKRDGTAAAGFPNQVSEHIKKERAKRLTLVGNESAEAFISRMIEASVLFEEAENGGVSGYSREYTRVFVPNAPADLIGAVRKVRLDGSGAVIL
ncbi:tRNA (N(6)-L-threonylcarbamoyladenosine(37)-C(2))-methylthiotransferase MtaB [Clostridia bacterium]|nr:tRNA (N(6)-L-threonylcarbamoyladenosine(37)-C(2))-methylthiotransferase MtaB [Clostridia bacterium]